MKSIEEKKRLVIKADGRNLSCIVLANVEFTQRMETFSVKHQKYFYYFNGFSSFIHSLHEIYRNIESFSDITVDLCIQVPMYHIRSMI